MTTILFTDADVFAGTERYMLELARALHAGGARPQVACPSPSPLADRSTKSGIPVVAIAKNGLIDRAAVRTLRSILTTGDAQIIHAQNGRTNLSAALAIHLAGRGRCVLTQHFLEPDHTTKSGAKGALFRAAHCWVHRHTDHFIAISEAARANMLARGDAPPDRITVVHNGISDVDAGSLATKEALRRELCVAPDAPVVACVARLEREKDVASLVRAMAVVVAQLPGAVCLVAGDGGQRGELTSQIAALGLERSVRLLGFRADALALIRAADIFCLPSLAEPFGLVILEAMALGRPVVATAAGGPLEIVAEGETGLLVPPATPEALAGALLRLLRDGDLRREMGAAGRERFLARFTADRMARETLAVYEKVLACT